MKDDARDRDSLGEFQSSIFDASDGHQLVDFIRKKKGLRTQPLKIFDDVRTERQSLQIEIQRLDDHEKTLQSKESRSNNAVEAVVPPINPQPGRPDEPRSPHRSPSRTSASLNSKVKLKRLSHSIGRRTLLKEFEKTIQESAFLPPTFSTPLMSNLPNPPAINVDNNTQHELVSLPKGSNITSDKQSNFRLVCSPITLTDNDSPSQEIVNAAHAGKTITPTESDNTEKCMRHLQQQNDFLLELAKSNEDLCLRGDSPEPEYTEQNKENPKNPIQSPIYCNRTSTTSKEQRRTYTIQRDNTSGKFILSPDKSIENSVRHPLSPKTPIKNTIGFKLIGTPEQRKLLLTRFGRNSTNNAHTSQKPAIDQNTFSKFNSVASERAHVSGFSGESHYKEAANVTLQSPKHQNTAQIIEQIQKSGPSNVPVIVIPVNQTFNQASNATSPTKASTYMNSPNSNEITSTTTITAPQPKPPDCSPVRKSNLPLNSLRLQDIITDDESSCTDESARTRLYTRKSSTSSIQNANRLMQDKKQFRIRLPPPRNSSRHIRELVSPQRLTEMSTNEVLDLRKRNSNGDLRKHLSKREMSLFDKQIELELLRRSIQEPNYEDEVFQMGELPEPPKEFSDRRKSSKLQKSLQMDEAATQNDLVDECSLDRVSLVTNPMKKLSQSTAGRKPRGKKKEMSEQLANYLEASQRVSRSKYLNLSKRKLYNKGNSDETSSEDKSPDMIASFRKSETSRKTLKSPRKSNQHKSIINKTPTKTPPRPINSSAIHKSPLALFPTTPINPPADFADQSKAQRENEIFKKPVGRPPRKRTSPRKQKHLKKYRSAASSPVDPDLASSTTSNLSESSTVRRSTRAKKAPTAYWSCSNNELRPMYDIYRVYTTSIESKRAKYESSKKQKLVANTKTTQSNSVDNRQKNRQTNRKKGKSNEQAESTNTSSICPSYHGTSSSSDYQLNFPTTNIPGAFSEDQSHPSSDTSTTVEKVSKTKKPTEKIPLNTDKNESDEISNAVQKSVGNKEKQIKIKLRGPKSRRGPSTDSESISSLEGPHPAELTTIMENSHSETSQISRISDLRETSKSKSKISISKSRKLITSQEEFSLSDDQQLHDTTKTSKTSKQTERRQFSSDEDESSSVNDLQPQVRAKSSGMRQIPTPKSKTGNSISSNFSSDAPESPTAETLQSQSSAKISKSREAKQKSKRKIEKFSTDEFMSSSDVPQSKSTANASSLQGSKSKSRYLSAESDSASTDNSKTKSTANKKKSASSKSKKLQPPTGCASEDNSSSIQQIRHLTTIAEDSLPEFEQQITISVSELEKESNAHHRLGTKSITSNRGDRIKDAFRAEHDRSIADVSSAHVNKLFEQLKSSSMCINGEVTDKRVNCSGKVSQDNRLLNDQSSAQHKCKNLTVRVLRSRCVIKSPEGNDKVCDSGFSSEDVSSEQKQQRGDILLNWLKQIISKSPIDSQKGVARFLQSDGFHAARIDDLVFQEVDGVDYAFYNTKQRFSFGYMRFNPKTEKKRCTAKKYELNFLVLCGSIKITVNGNTFDCKNGDLITVFVGTLYGISNNSNDPALVMVIKK